MSALSDALQKIAEQERELIELRTRDAINAHFTEQTEARVEQMAPLIVRLIEYFLAVDPMHPNKEKLVEILEKLKV